MITSTVDRSEDAGLAAPSPQVASQSRPRTAQAPDVGPAGPAPRRPPSHDGVSRLLLCGDLTAPQGPQLAWQLEEFASIRATTLQVDMSSVTHVDAAIARLILRHAWRLEKDQRSLLLIHAAPKVRRVLAWSGAGYLIIR